MYHEAESDGRHRLGEGKHKFASSFLAFITAQFGKALPDMPTIQAESTLSAVLICILSKKPHMHISCNTF